MSIDLTKADKIAIKRAETEQCSGEFLSDGISGYERAYRAGLAAGRARAIEDAARVCVDFSNDELLTLDERYATAVCADTIRALINPPA